MDSPLPKYPLNTSNGLCYGQMRVSSNSNDYQNKIINNEKLTNNSITKENFNLVKDYRMVEHNTPLFKNTDFIQGSKNISKNLCRNCVIGRCVGDVCGRNPDQPEEGNMLL